MKRRALLGFTLIELLVVIAIIAILAAILFPVFANARERGRVVTCASDLKQIGHALHMYTEDNDEQYPGTLAFSLQSQLQRYLKNTAVWTCPSQADLQDSYFFTPSYLPSGQFFSPGCNIEITRYLSTIQRPATTITFMEATSPKWYWYPTPSPGASESEARQVSPTNRMGTRHRGKGNYLFADGHVKLLSVRQTLTPTVLWDNISEWCPTCDCTEPPISGVNRWWTPLRLQEDLQELDKYHYP